MIKNNNYHQTILHYLLLIILSLILFFFLNLYEYHIYTLNYNRTLNNLINNIVESYPSLDEKTLITAINQPASSDILLKYGIDINDDSIILPNNQSFLIFTIYNLVFLGIIFFIFYLILYFYHSYQKRQAHLLTSYLDELSKKNYQLKISTNSEDELSILQNEIYKITVMLKEESTNASLAKNKLKDSLSDISHQLKTPLTSITLMLDNLSDNPNMPLTKRTEFINDINKELTNINFLIQNILKLSKFDANTITFINKQVSLYSIVFTSLNHLAPLADLKNITFDTNGLIDYTINVDQNWQVEALTNIIKNCLEHTPEFKVISISSHSNQIYTALSIHDEEEGISPKDLPHIFDRFYKGENASSDSIGIGLALAKSIITAQNGYITVTSSINHGTTFTIKYYN